MYGNTRNFVVQAEGQLLTAASYGPVIIAYRNGNPVRLNEVAHVYDGVENDKAGDKFMDKPSIDISISKQPGTNVVQVVDDVKALLGLCDSRTRVLAISAVQFWSGFRADLGALSKGLRGREVLLVVDAMQAVGALKIDLSTMAVALLAAGAHFTQVLPDIEAERRLGIRGLPHLLGTRGSTLAAALLLAGSALLILLGPGHPGELQLAALGLTFLLIAGVTFAGLSGRHRLSFRLTLLTAGGVAVIFVLSGRGLA